jgi:hypothetical protein
MFAIKKKNKEKQNNFHIKNIQVSLLGKRIDCFIFDFDFSIFFSILVKNKPFFYKNITSLKQNFYNFLFQKTKFLHQKSSEENINVWEIVFEKIKRLIIKIQIKKLNLVKQIIKQNFIY